MASQVPLIPFLRPLRLPQPSTVRLFLRFSTSTISRAGRQGGRRAEDTNLAASRTASPSYPPPSIKSPPRPKESRASRRTSHPPKQRHYPTRQPSHTQSTQQKLIPEPVEPLPSAKCAPNLPYFITRTESNELPIYTLQKRGGNLKMTRVKKIDGDVEVLRDELRGVLGLDGKECVVNPVTQHIMMKGHHKPRIDRFLRERMF